MLTISFLVPLALASATSVSAAFQTHCTSPPLVPNLPPNQANLTLPSGQTAAFVSIGRGVQNYTCTSGKYVSAGAVAQLFDVSCLDPITFPAIPIFALGQPFEARANPAPPTQKFRRQTIPSADGKTTGFTLFNAIRNFHDGVPYAEIPGYLGVHTFISSNGKIAPKFDFSQSQGNQQFFVVGAGEGTVPSSVDPVRDVASLQLKGVDGALAKTVFRLDSAGGQPPSSCSSEGSSLSVDYAAMYWFMQ